MTGESLVCCSPWYHRVRHCLVTEQQQMYVCVRVRVCVCVYIIRYFSCTLPIEAIFE